MNEIITADQRKRKAQFTCDIFDRFDDAQFVIPRKRKISKESEALLLKYWIKGIDLEKYAKRTTKAKEMEFYSRCAIKNVLYLIIYYEFLGYSSEQCFEFSDDVFRFGRGKGTFTMFDDQIEDFDALMKKHALRYAAATSYRGMVFYTNRKQLTEMLDVLNAEKDSDGFVSLLFD